MSVTSLCAVCVRLGPEELASSLSVLSVCVVRNVVMCGFVCLVSPVSPRRVLTVSLRSGSVTVDRLPTTLCLQQVGAYVQNQGRGGEARFLQKSFAFYSQGRERAEETVIIASSFTFLRETRQAENHKRGSTS